MPVIILVLLLLPGRAPAQPFSEQITIDGSSTLFPVSEAIADEFQLANPTIRVIVGISGTRRGFKELLSASIDILNASRPITRAENADAQLRGMEYLELPVALDGISVVVNPKNDWIDHLTMAELQRLWARDGGVSRWSDLRQNWPDRPIRLYGPGAESGTYEYFTRTVLGEKHESRQDYTASENDTVLVQGIGHDLDALGYFGHGYYTRNRARLRLVSIDAGNGPVLPTIDSITSGTYQPLVRPLFLYVRADTAKRAAVQDFIHFYLQHATVLVPGAGYIALPAPAYELTRTRFDRHQRGSLFGAGKHPDQPDQDVIGVLGADLGS